MSLLDIQNQFTANTVPNAGANAGLVTEPGDTMIHATGTVLATNIIDMWNGQSSIPVPPLGGPEIVDFGRGRPMLVMTEILVTCVGSGATVSFQLFTSDNNDGSGNQTVHQQTAAFPVGTLMKGYKPYLPMLNAGLNRTVTNRYLGLQWVLAGAALTVGAFCSNLVIDDATNVPAV